MINLPPRNWLSAVPWDTVLTLNRTLCQAQKVDCRPSPPAFENVRSRWEVAVGKSSGIVDVLECLRECCQALPFACNNGNTFAAIARTLVNDWLEAMPPLEAQILRTTVCHFVAGQVGKKELIQILKHFSPACRNGLPAKTPPEPAPARRIEPEAAV